MWISRTLKGLAAGPLGLRCRIVTCRFSPKELNGRCLQGATLRAMQRRAASPAGSWCVGLPGRGRVRRSKRLSVKHPVAKASFSHLKRIKLGHCVASTISKSLSPHHVDREG